MWGFVSGRFDCLYPQQVMMCEYAYAQYVPCTQLVSMYKNINVYHPNAVFDEFCVYTKKKTMVRKLFNYSQFFFFLLLFSFLSLLVFFQLHYLLFSLSCFCIFLHMVSREKCVYSRNYEYIHVHIGKQHCFARTYTHTHTHTLVYQHMHTRTNEMKLHKKNSSRLFGNIFFQFLLLSLCVSAGCFQFFFCQYRKKGKI